MRLHWGDEDYPPRQHVGGWYSWRKERLLENFGQGQMHFEVHGAGGCLAASICWPCSMGNRMLWDEQMLKKPLPSGWVVMCPTWKNHVLNCFCLEAKWKQRSQLGICNAHRWGWISRLPGLWPIAVRCQGMEKVVFDIINPKSITMILGMMDTSPLRNGKGYSLVI